MAIAIPIGGRRNDSARRHGSRPVLFDRKRQVYLPRYRPADSDAVFSVACVGDTDRGHKGGAHLKHQVAAGPLRKRWLYAPTFKLFEQPHANWTRFRRNGWVLGAKFVLQEWVGKFGRARRPAEILGQYLGILKSAVVSRSARFATFTLFLVL
jgi:hypothetical protein